jgi:hypothetical protein
MAHRRRCRHRRSASQRAGPDGSRRPSRNRLRISRFAHSPLVAPSFRLLEPCRARQFVGGPMDRLVECHPRERVPAPLLRCKITHHRSSGIARSILDCLLARKRDRVREQSDDEQVPKIAELSGVSLRPRNCAEVGASSFDQISREVHMPAKPKARKAIAKPIAKTRTGRGQRSCRRPRLSPQPGARASGAKKNQSALGRRFMVNSIRPSPRSRQLSTSVM